MYVRDGRRVFMDTLMQLILCLLWLLYRILLQLLTGDSAAGYWSLSCDILLLFVFITSGGFTQAVSRMILNTRSRHNSVNEYGMIRYAMLSSLGFGAVCSIILYLLAPQICFLLYGNALRPVSVSLRVMAPAVLCMSISGVLRGYFKGIGTIRPGRISQFLFVIVSFIGSLVSFVAVKGEEASFLAGIGSFGILFGSIASMLLLLAVYTVYRQHLIRRARKDEIHTENNYSSFLRNFFAGFRPFIMTTIGISVFLLTDASLYAHFTGANGYDAALITSLYGILTGKYLPMLCIPMIILLYAMPAGIAETSDAYIHGENLRQTVSMQKMMRYTMIAAIPAALSSAVAGDAFAGLFFGDFSIMTRKILLAGAPLILLTAYAAASCFMLTAIDRLKTVLINGLAAFALHLLFLIILLSYSDMNIYAMLYSDTIFAFTFAALNILYLVRHTSFSHEYVRMFLQPAGASVVTAMVLFLVFHGLIRAQFPGRLSALVALLLSAFLYGVVLILMKGISQKEMREYPLGKAFAAIAVRLHLF